MAGVNVDKNLKDMSVYRRCVEGLAVHPRYFFEVVSRSVGGVERFGDGLFFRRRFRGLYVGREEPLDYAFRHHAVELGFVLDGYQVFKEYLVVDCIRREVNAFVL